MDDTGKRWTVKEQAHPIGRTTYYDDRACGVAWCSQEAFSRLLDQIAESNQPADERPLTMTVGAIRDLTGRDNPQHGRVEVKIADGKWADAAQYQLGKLPTGASVVARIVEPCRYCRGSGECPPAPAVPVGEPSETVQVPRGAWDAFIVAHDAACIITTPGDRCLSLGAAIAARTALIHAAHNLARSAPSVAVDESEQDA